MGVQTITVSLHDPPSTEVRRPEMVISAPETSQRDLEAQDADRYECDDVVTPRIFIHSCFRSVGDVDLGVTPSKQP